MAWPLAILLSVLLMLSGFASVSQAAVVEFPLAWPSQARGSTHEITYRKGGHSIWISGQTHDHITEMSADGTAEFFPMPTGSGPHGLVFDSNGHLWVSLEFKGSVARIDEHGQIEAEVDVRIQPEGAQMPINTSPHGLGLGADGHTIWFTGKKTNTVGRINKQGSVEHFELPTVGAVPIYLASGPDGNMWCTELVGNQIARITPSGEVTEFAIPTPNSRPIAIVPGPDRRSMWFSEEASHQVARIDMNGKISEFPVPATRKNMLLAGMAFDRNGNLWTESYVDQGNPMPGRVNHRPQENADQIITIARAISTASSPDLSGIPITYQQVPTQNTILHRILQGPDGNIWFTELGVDQVGRLKPVR